MGAGDIPACAMLLALALAIGAAVAAAVTRKDAPARPRPLGASAVAELSAVVETLRGVDTERAIRALERSDVSLGALRSMSPRRACDVLRAAGLSMGAAKKLACRVARGRDFFAPLRAVRARAHVALVLLAVVGAASGAPRG